MEGCQVFTLALTSGWLGLILDRVSSDLNFFCFCYLRPVMFMFCYSYDDYMNPRFRSMEHLECGAVRFGGGYTRSLSAFISAVEDASLCVGLNWGCIF